jgi:hypothetical protein
MEQSIVQGRKAGGKEGKTHDGENKVDGVSDKNDSAVTHKRTGERLYEVLCSMGVDGGQNVVE